MSELIYSQDTQDDDPGTSKSQIQRETGIYRSTVRRIAKIWSEVQDMNFLLAIVTEKTMSFVMSRSTSCRLKIQQQMCLNLNTRVEYL